MYVKDEQIKDMQLMMEHKVKGIRDTQVEYKEDLDKFYT